MEHLWAPWRIGYILQDSRSDDCIFCRKPAEQEDTSNLILYRGPATFVILNTFPYNNGHLMVVPYRHLAGLEELYPAERAEMMEVCARSVRILKQVMAPHGFNLGLNLGPVAGAGIADHLHLHIVPRWQGDTNFMSVLADARVVPECLQATYERLRPFFAEEGETL